MSDLQVPHSLSLTGEVVETFERDGVPVATIRLKPVHMEVPLQSLHGAHLGDSVRLRITCSVQHIDQDPHIENI
jgi:hypothetical protein